MMRSRRMRRMNESAVIDGAKANWDEIKPGDVVSWTTKGATFLPEVGSKFRVGDISGKCTKVTKSEVLMKVEYNSNLNESIDYSDDIYQGEKYCVSGTNNNKLIASSRNICTSDPREAIISWFKLSARFGVTTDIYTRSRRDAFRLIEYAIDNLDLIVDCFNRYNVPDIEDYFMSQLDRQYRTKCRTFYEDDEFGSIIYPFAEVYHTSII